MKNHPIKRLIQRISLMIPLSWAIVCALPAAMAESPVPLWPAANPQLVKFDEQVKKDFLSWRKNTALAELATAKVEIPADFLAWVDSNPLVFQTIYGFDNSQPHRLPALPKGVIMDRTDSPAQRLVCLLSLEIDLGPQLTRERNQQLALALTHAYAGKIDRKTFECPEEKLSWKPRPRLDLVIPANPLLPVNTRATDRPLDREDHIINFLEDHPQPVDPKKPAAGTRPLFASELMASDELRAKFVTYMKERGHQIDPRHVTHSKAGYDMFLKAYHEKGRIPKAQDPVPTPAEKMAYLVRNDQFRFPPDVKRSWPRFNLESPWPVLEYLAMGDMPLRDREFVWNRFRETGSVRKMGHHLGAKLGLNTPVVRARRMQPFDFAYGSYAMDIKDHGACREMARIGLGAAAPLGIPAAHSFQPGHFCLSVVSYSEKSGYGLKVEQFVRHPTWITKGGVRLEDELARLFHSLNYGLEAMLDAHSGLALYRHLPPATPAAQRIQFLASLLDINPYVPAIPREILNQHDDLTAIAEFWQRFTRQVEAVKRTGCPPGGHYTGFTVRRMLDARLTSLPVPQDPRSRQLVIDLCLAESSNDLWLKYAGHGKSSEEMQQWGLTALRKAVSSPRNDQSAALVSARLATIGKTIKDENQRRAWGNSLLATLRGKEIFHIGEGKKRREIADPAVLVAQNLAGQTPDARATLERDLRQSVSGGRSPAKAALLAQRLAAIAKGMRKADERRAWGETLHSIVLGQETYVTPQNPDQPQFDPAVKEIYNLGVDLSPARKRFAADFARYLKSERTLHMARAMDQRLATLVAAARDQETNTPFIQSLSATAKGRESFTEPSADPNQPGKSHKDPVVARVHKLLPAETARR
jgi:hypothetical protein